MWLLADQGGQGAVILHGLAVRAHHQMRFKPNDAIPQLKIKACHHTDDHNQHSHPQHHPNDGNQGNDGNKCSPGSQVTQSKQKFEGQSIHDSSDLLTSAAARWAKVYTPQRVATKPVVKGP